MHVLICINNNLKYDTRVKRHTLAAAAHGHQVHVAACPVPDEQFALRQPQITYSMSPYTPGEHPKNEKILEFAKEFGLDNLFLESFPLLNCAAYYYEPYMETYTHLLNHYVKGGRWTDITTRCSEKMSLSDAVSYPLCFFERSVQYAQDVLNVPADVVLCNDVDTLLAGVVHKIRYHSRLIYDFHDIAADISENVFPQMYSNVLALFEKKMIQYADVVMSVSTSALVWSKQHYGFAAPMIYMPNCSAYSMKKSIVSKKYGRQLSAGEKIRIYYHGMCDHARGLSELLQAVKTCGYAEHFQLVFRCLPSEYLEKIKELAASMGIASSVVFLEPVSPNEILDAAGRDGDIGFAFCQTKKCLNWRFALQNKFIEYTKAGLAVITSDTAEQGNIVKKYKIGWVLEENTAAAIAKVLAEIYRERKHLHKMSKKAWKCAEQLFDWNRYEKRFISAIESRKKTSWYSLNDKADQHLLQLWDQEDADNLRDALMMPSKESGN